jgi:hypothetical protein
VVSRARHQCHVISGGTVPLAQGVPFDETMLRTLALAGLASASARKMLQGPVVQQAAQFQQQTQQLQVRTQTPARVGDAQTQAGPVQGRRLGPCVCGAREARGRAVVVPGVCKHLHRPSARARAPRAKATPCSGRCSARLPGSDGLVPPSVRGGRRGPDVLGC